MIESEQAKNETANLESPARMYAVVLSVGVCCSLAIVATYELTRPIIARKQIAMRQAGIFQVLPAAVTTKAFRYDETSGRFEPVSSDTAETNVVFAGFNARDELVGLAIETRGMGYQDFIRMLYGYSIDSQAVIGIRVLESRETPGLGDRIETDEAFLSNFAHLDVRVNASGSALEHGIEYVKPGKKSDAWQIDGITGATISSRAVAEMLDASTAHWIPRIRAHRSEFTSPQQQEQP